MSIFLIVLGGITTAMISPVGFRSRKWAARYREAYPDEIALTANQQTAISVLILIVGLVFLALGIALRMHLVRPHG